jgi:hypothetical protein
VPPCGCAGVAAAGTRQLARHWNVTVFVPLPFETMF